MAGKGPSLYRTISRLCESNFSQNHQIRPAHACRRNSMPTAAPQPSTRHRTVGVRKDAKVARYLLVYMELSENVGPPKSCISIELYYKPSILGYLHCRKGPFLSSLESFAWSYGHKYLTAIAAGYFFCGKSWCLDPAALPALADQVAQLCRKRSAAAVGWAHKWPGWSIPRKIYV